MLVYPFIHLKGQLLQPTLRNDFKEKNTSKINIFFYNKLVFLSDIS